MAPVKRHHQYEESVNDKDSERRTRVRQDDGMGASTNLDLNARPTKDFDLNAPMVEDPQDTEVQNVESETEIHEAQQDPALSSFSFRQLESAKALGINEDLDILHIIWTAYENHDIDSVDETVSRTCEELARNPYNCSRYHYLTCIYVSKKLPEVFTLQKTFKSVKSFFASGNYQTVAKKHLLLPVLAAKLLLRGFESVEEWPLEFVKIYLEDAIGQRGWIDHDGCKEFVVNIVTAFSDERTITIKNRYPSADIRRIARMEFLKAVQSLLASSTTKENIKQLLKLLIQGVGYDEVRVLGSSMLESWLNSPIHLRAAKSLLDEIIENLHGVTENDLITVENLLSLRVQSSQMANQMKSLHGNIYTEMLNNLVSRRHEYASIALKTFVLAEISGKSLFNMRCISVVLKAMPVSPSPELELAAILQDQAMNANIRSQLQDFGRRLLKHMGHDLNLRALCHGLLQSSGTRNIKEDSFMEDWLNQIVDFTCQLLLHGMSHLAGDESIIQILKDLEGSRANVSDYFGILTSTQDRLLMLEKVSQELAAFQVDAIEWCTTVLVTLFPAISNIHFRSIIQKLLFLEDPQVYFRNSDNCSDLELSSYKVLCFCSQASEEILARLIFMGVSSNIPLTRAEVLQILERLVKRAAISAKYIKCSLRSESTQLPAAILKLASYSPNEIGPQSSLQVVHKDLYWRSCLIVLLLTVNNAHNLGKYVWQNIPTVKCLLEAIITCNTGAMCQNQVIREVEMSEREVIAKFIMDQHGADHMDLVDDLMLLDLSRLIKPPEAVLKEVDNAEKSFNLGQLLWKCREPDFFVEITTSQSLGCAWPWLQKVLAREPGLVKRLPLTWQVEILFAYEGFDPFNQTHFVDLRHIYASLTLAIEESDEKKSDVEAALDFLVSKLGSLECYLRSRSRRCLAGILDPSLLRQDMESSKEQLAWLNSLDSLPVGKMLIGKLCNAIRHSIHLEDSLDVVGAYLLFLKRHLPPPPSPMSLGQVVAKLTVHRRMLTASLLQSSLKSSLKSSFEIVVNCFLEAVKETLEIGLNPESDASGDSLRTDLIVPCYQQDGKFIGFQKTSVTKFVLDASVEILYLLSSGPGEFKDTNIFYEKIIQLLFPSFLTPRERSEDYIMGWVEDRSGTKISLLSEKQAHMMSRSKDERLLQAGLQVLSKNEKVGICASLGLSNAAVANFRRNMSSLNIWSPGQFKTGSYVSKIRNGWKKMEFMNVVLCTSQNPATEMSLNDNGNDDFKIDADEDMKEATPAAMTPITNIFTKDLLLHPIPLCPTKDFVSIYIKTRKGLQELCSLGMDMKCFLDQEFVPNELLRVEHSFWQETTRLRTQLPILVNLAAYKVIVMHLMEAHHETVSSDYMYDNRKMFPGFTFQHRIEAGEFANCLVKILTRQSGREKPYSAGTQETVSGSTGNDSTQSCLSVDNVESYMKFHLEACIPKEGKNSFDIDMLCKILSELMHSGQDKLTSKSLLELSFCNEAILEAGISGLLVRIFDFTDNKIILDESLIKLFEGQKDLVVPLLLGYVFHHCSLEFGSTVLKRVVNAIGKHISNEGQFTSLINRGTQIELCMVVDALLACFFGIINDPYMKPVNQKNGSDYYQSSMANIAGSVITPITARVISVLSVLLSTMSRVLCKSKCTENEHTYRFVAMKNWLKYEETAIKVLVCVAGYNNSTLRAMIIELWELMRRFETAASNIFEKQFSQTANELLWRLYIVWPYSVESAMLSGSMQEFMLSGTDAVARNYLLGQTSTSVGRVHRTVLSSLSRFANETDTNYRFCRALAKQQPALILNCVPAIAVLLKARIQEVKLIPRGGDPETHKHTAMILLRGITLIDSLRPLIFLGSKTWCISCSNLSDSTDNGLKTILVSYMEFLQNLETEDVVHYSKLVARLADFLCHCLAFGGQWGDIVKDCRDQIQRAAEKFSKIKKLSYVLNFLDSRKLNNERVDCRVLQPELPYQQVQMVRKQLRYFSSLQNETVLESAKRRGQIVQHDLLEMEDEIGEMDLLAILTDLDQASSRLPSILPMLDDVLIELVQANDINVRNIIFNLLERLFHEAPSEDIMRRFIEVLLKQLISMDSNRGRSAADQAVRFFFFCPDAQERILSQLFQSMPGHFGNFVKELLLLGV